MFIECLVKREEPIVVPIGNETYRFEPDAHGRNVAEVWLESHIESFLAVSHLYRPVRDDAALSAKPAAIVTVSGDDLGLVREEYTRVMGKKPFNGWDVATLRAKMAAKG